MKFPILAFFLSAAMLVSVVHAATLDRIAAIVNDEVITLNELEEQVDTVRKQIRAQNTLPPPNDVLRKQVLEREIVKQVQLQFAKNTGIFVDDNALNNAIENIAAQNNMSLQAFHDVLERDGYDFARFREDIRNEMIISRLRQREISNAIRVTDQEVDSFISTQQLQGFSDDEFLVSHILIALPEAATPEVIGNTRQRAETVLADLEKGADFSQTAISVSDGQQALEGGSLGWRKLGQLPTIFARPLTRMKKGEISEIIRSPSGFHIIKLVDKRAGEQHIISQTHARHILIRPSELVTETEIISRLRQLKDRIEGGDSFEELAKSHSDDPGSRVNGGDLGWVNPGDMVPQFEAVMDQLKPNQVSEPFQTPFGWHIVQVLERRTLDNSDEYRRNQAREFLRQRKIDEATESWIRQLRDEAFVEVKIDP